MKEADDVGADEHSGPFFRVNERKGTVEPQGEELDGKTILARVGLSHEKYELFPIEQGKTGSEIQPDMRVNVKPGDRFRATIRGTDYSTPEDQ